MRSLLTLAALLALTGAVQAHHYAGFRAGFYGGGHAFAAQSFYGYGHGYSALVVPSVPLVAAYAAPVVQPVAAPAVQPAPVVQAVAAPPVVAAVATPSYAYGAVSAVAVAPVVVRHRGTTPFNLLPMANTESVSSAGAFGHGAGTPLALCRWWVRYLCPPGGTVLDPFAGSGTVPLAALKEGRRFVGVERVPEYYQIAERRVAAELAKAPLYQGEPA